MFGSNEISLKEAIRQLMQTYRLEGKMNEVRLINSWDKVAGGIISKHTTNLKIKKRKLFVSLDSAALRSELSYSREKIVKMLNQEVGEQVIDEIIFT